MNPPSLCQPGLGLACFACCPPIRPAGYDHAEHRGPLRRLFSENRTDYLAGRLPSGPTLGFSCPGLGFLDSQGRQVGCLLHPARNDGRDLRQITGYAAKCARESCPEARAFARLPEPVRSRLLGLCQGLDAFAFGSRRENPVMRLLSFGPVVAAAAAGLAPATLASLVDLGAWAWLGQAPPAWGWLLGLATEARNASLLAGPELAARLAAAMAELGRALGPPPPLEQGQPLAALADEWEARFWRALSGRRRLPAGLLTRWRELARDAAAGLG